MLDLHQHQQLHFLHPHPYPQPHHLQSNPAHQNIQHLNKGVREHSHSLNQSQSWSHSQSIQSWNTNLRASKQDFKIKCFWHLIIDICDVKSKQQQLTIGDRHKVCLIQKLRLFIFHIEVSSKSHTKLKKELILPHE